jgi:glutamyl-tRNA synthetase
VRVEDADQSREVEGVLAQFERAFDYFRVQPTEGEGNGAYGPYLQSARERIYLT